MAVDESALAAELGSHHGVTTVRRLDRLGIGKRCVDGLVANGRLKRAGNGVLVSTCWPVTLEHQMAVGCAITGGVVCFPTAGLVWELRKSPRVPEIHLWIPNGRCVVKRDGLRVHRTRHLPDTDVVKRRDGIQITSPPRTAFDAAAWLTPDDLESLIEHGIHHPYFTVPTLWGLARRLCRSGRTGSTHFVAVLTARPIWRRPVDSDHELRLERAMRDRGFPPLTRGHRLHLSTGEVIHPDLGLPDSGFFVEVDHLSWHGFRRETAYDRRRDMKVRADGYHVERVTDTALDEDLEATIEDLWTIWQGLL
jgi:very-short-patch-repair endonuclease